MGMILQGFEGDRSKNRAGKTLIISYARVRAAGGRATVGSGNNRNRRGKVVATRSPFYGLYHKRAFYQLTPPATASWKYQG